MPDLSDNKELRKCQASDCEKKHSAKGYCSMHYQRLKNGGSLDARHQEYHGEQGTRLYSVWQAMKHRCNNSNHPRFHHYGGRGIKVCERWQHSYLNFKNDMGERPEGYTLERIDNNGDYEPNNCIWASVSEQNWNQRKTRKYLGKTAKDWAEELNAYLPSFKAYVVRYSFDKAVEHYKGRQARGERGSAKK